jgi:hypothetical protein
VRIISLDLVRDLLAVASSLADGFCGVEARGGPEGGAEVGSGLGVDVGRYGEVF